MADEAAAPSAASEGTAAPAAPATDTTTTAPATTDAAQAAAQAEQAPSETRADYNKRVIEAERAKRRAEKERKAAEAAREDTKRERAEIERVRAESAKERERVDAFDRAIADAKRNPGKFLEATGLTLDDLVRWKINDGEISPELLVKDAAERTAAETRELREKLEALENERKAERDAVERHAVEQRAASAQTQIRGQITELVKSAPEKYEMIEALGEHDEVYRLMEGTYLHALKRAGGDPRGVSERDVLTHEQAADKVEEYLRSRWGVASKTKWWTAQHAQPTAATSQQAATTPRASTPDARAAASALTANNVTAPATPTELERPIEDREAFLERTRAKFKARKAEAAKAK